MLNETSERIREFCPPRIYSSYVCVCNGKDIDLCVQSRMCLTEELGDGALLLDLRTPSLRRGSPLHLILLGKIDIPPLVQPLTTRYTHM